MSLQRLVITCGGTGGHFYPGLATALCFKEKYAGEVLLLLSGANGAAQAEVARQAGVEAVALPPMPNPRKPANLPRFAKGLLQGAAAARRELLRFRPQGVLAMGSFASLPVMLAGSSLKLPRFLHDGNARIGRANRLFSRGAKFVATAFPAVNAKSCHAPVIPTGMPLRRTLVNQENITKADAIRELNQLFERRFDPQKPVILILGGSQGATTFNTICPAALKRLDPTQFQVLHLAGPKRQEEALEAYRHAAFPHLILASSERMELFMGAADLAFCRSGGSTVAELTLFGVPAILVPYPHAAEDHQSDNARYMASAGAAIHLKPNEFSEEVAFEVFRDFLTHPLEWKQRSHEALSLARPWAAEELIDLIATRFPEN